MPEEDPELPQTLLQIENRLLFNLIIVGCVVVVAWIFGSFGVSSGWIVLLLLLILVIWKSTFISLVSQAVQVEKDRLRRKKMLQNMSESCEWLNLLINRWWQVSSKTIFNLLKDTLDPIFYESKPSFVESIELKHFCIGESTPYIKFVRAYDFPSSYDQRKTDEEFYECFPKSHTVTQVALELDIVLCSNDFRMIFKTRLGGRALGVDLDASVETLNFRGKAFLILDIDATVPFPHIPKFSITFLKKPDVWFSIRILKSVQMMEVPGLKSWIHSLFMSTLTAVLVDPGKLDVHVFPQENEISSDQTSNNITAIGVLTVTVQVALQGKAAVCMLVNEDSRWCVLRLGEQKHRSASISSQASWQDCSSFIVSSLTDDFISLKVKSKRLVSQVTLVEHSIQLSDYDLENSKTAEVVLQKKNMFISNLNIKTSLPPLSIRLEYTPLVPAANVKSDPAQDLRNIQSTDNLDQSEKSKSDLSGIMYVCVHSAELNPSGCEKDSELPYPYCLIFNGKDKVRTTHYIANSSNPLWESHVEFLTTNYTKASITFFVCNWNGDGYTYDTNMIGFSSLTIHQNQTCFHKEKLPLTQYAGSETIGNVIVTVIFRNVPTVCQSELSQLDSVSSLTSTKSSKNRSKKRKIFLGGRDEVFNNDITSLVSQGSGVMELVVMCACDLVAKDLNGFSDPYCEIKVDDEVVFKTCVKKKTLFPEWNESVTIKLPSEKETFRIIVWDWDAIGRRDFIGDLILTLEDIHKHSLNEVPEWFLLKNTKSGSIKLQMRIVMESERTKRESRSSHPNDESSPNLESSHGVEVERAGKSQPHESEKSSNFEKQISSEQTEKECEVISLREENSPRNPSPFKKSTSASNLVFAKENQSQQNISVTRSLSTSQSINDSKRQQNYQNIQGTISCIECSKAMLGKYYCKVKLMKNKQNSSKELRIAKSELFTFMDNKAVTFSLEFKIDVFQRVNPNALFSIQIVSETKEVISSISIALFELLKGAAEKKEIRRQLQLSPDGKVNISISHGKPIQSSVLRSGSRILKSLSMHRISKSNSKEGDCSAQS